MTKYSLNLSISRALGMHIKLGYDEMWNSLTMEQTLHAQKLEQEVREVCEVATTGKFLDATQKPTAILLEMMQVIFKF